MWDLNFGTWISHRGLHSGLRPWAPTSINSRSASVRDTTVPRFNPPAEPARTVGFGNQAASAREIPKEPGSERTSGTGPDSRIRKTGFGPDSRIRKPGSERTRDPGRTRKRAHERSRKNQAASARERDLTVREREIGCGDRGRRVQRSEPACIFYGRTARA